MPQKCVVDSSIIVKWLNPTNEGRVTQANVILDDLESGKLQIFVPELAKFEVGNALLVHKKLSFKEAEITLSNLYKLPIKFVTETVQLAREAFQIAYEAREKGLTQITYYDASFVSLAKQENATLVTDNPKHQKLISGATVVALEDYK